jgi:hypothetical protein
MQSFSGATRERPERVCKRYLSPPLCLYVEDGTARNADAEHFFKADSLSAELSIVIVPLPPLSSLVFNGKWHTLHPLDEIGHSLNAETVGDKSKAACCLARRRITVFLGVNATVRQGTGQGVGVLDPYSLHTMQEASPRAKQEVVER